MCSSLYALSSPSLSLSLSLSCIYFSESFSLRALLVCMYMCLVFVGWCLDWFCLGRCHSLSFFSAALILGFVSSIWAKFSNGDYNRGRPGERRRWVPPFAARAACFSKPVDYISQHPPPLCAIASSSFTHTAPLFRNHWSTHRCSCVGCHSSTRNNPSLPLSPVVCPVRVGPIAHTPKDTPRVFPC